MEDPIKIDDVGGTPIFGLTPIWLCNNLKMTMDNDINTEVRLPVQRTGRKIVEFLDIHPLSPHVLLPSQMTSHSICAQWMLSIFLMFPPTLQSKWPYHTRQGSSGRVISDFLQMQLPWNHMMAESYNFTKQKIRVTYNMLQTLSDMPSCVMYCDVLPWDFHKYHISHPGRNQEEAQNTSRVILDITPSPLSKW